MQSPFEPADEQAKRPAVPVGHKELWDFQDLTAVGVGSRTTIWRKLQTDPSFPRPVLVCGSMPRWIPAEIRAWISNRPRAA